VTSGPQGEPEFAWLGKVRDVSSAAPAPASRSRSAAAFQQRLPVTDRSAEELAALIQAKIAQQPPAAPAEEPVVLNLLEALKQSVAQANEAEKVAQTSAAAQSRKPRARRKSG
jgi:hypothetical protein